MMDLFKSMLRTTYRSNRMQDVLVRRSSVPRNRARLWDALHIQEDALL